MQDFISSMKQNHNKVEKNVFFNRLGEQLYRFMQKFIYLLKILQLISNEVSEWYPFARN